MLFNSLSCTIPLYKQLFLAPYFFISSYFLRYTFASSSKGALSATTPFFHEAISCTILLYKELFLVPHLYILFQAASSATIPISSSSHFCHHTFAFSSKGTLSATSPFFPRSYFL